MAVPKRGRSKRATCLVMSLASLASAALIAGLLGGLLTHSARDHGTIRQVATSTVTNNASSSATSHSTTVPTTVPTNSPTNTALRIVPLGDSITAGLESSGGNGYRLDLLRMLNATFPNVEYVGTQHVGNMTNNANEGYGGDTIQQIAEAPGVNVTLSDGQNRPNLVLLHAGTNDLNALVPTLPVASAPQRLGALIDLIFTTCPQCTLIVAQIISCDCPGEVYMTTFKQGVADEVASRAAAGRKVLTVDMSGIGINGSDLVFGLHPDDVGYAKMARSWYSAVLKASGEGMIVSLTD